jgi:hypothetical protein
MPVAAGDNWKTRVAMTRWAAIVTLAVAMSGARPHAAAAMGRRISPAAPPDTVQVAPPTGDRTRDHASIAAAFERARPGDTIQFARGIYVVGEIIQDSTPGLTLLGSEAGTVLQGCTPDGYLKVRQEERELDRKVIFGHGIPHLPPDARAREDVLVKRCGMFRLIGGHDTVRDLTFGYTRIGLDLGYEYQQGYRPSPGGYLIEGNTFRNSMNGIRAGLWSRDSTVISHNTFVDTYHAVMAGGSHIHVLDNRVLAPAPSRVPADQHPSEALAITAMAPRKGAPEPANGRCHDNVIAGNLVEGYPSGITVDALPGTTCRNNVVRDNTIAVRRVALLSTSIDAGLFPPDETDSSYVGVPISVSAPIIQGRSGSVQGTRVEGNRILGAEGFGIVIRHASHNRIADNTIAGILVRDPFPGNGEPGAEASNGNGSGIWVSAGSAENEILGNTFEDIATYAVVLEGDRNTVRTLRASDRVHDLGTGNHVLSAVPVGAVQPGGALAAAAGSRGEAVAGAPTRAECQVWNRQKAYYRDLAAGDTAGFRTMWSRRFVGWPVGAPAPASMADTANFSRYLSSIVRAHEDSTRRWHYELRPMSVVGYGDDIVVTLYAQGSYMVDVRSGTKTPERWTKFIHTWKRYGSRWRIITGMAAPLEAFPPEPPAMRALEGCGHR